MNLIAALPRLRIDESPYSFILLIWAGLLGSIYVVTFSLQFAGIGLHSSITGIVILLFRDIVAALVGLWLWYNTVEGHCLLSHLPAPDRLEYFLVFIIIVLLGYYYADLYRYGAYHTTSILLIDQHSFSAPLRALTLVVYQQTITIGFLLDAHRARFGHRRGLYITALLFSGTHLFSILWMEWSFAVLLSVGSLFAILVWGWLRIARKAHYAPMLSHYIFYLVMLST